MMGAADEKMEDFAVMQCKQYPQVQSGNFFAMPADFAPIDRSEPLAMAGFAGMAALPFEEEHRIADMTRNLVVRASHMAPTADAPWARPGADVWRMLMPSEPGMSGGPLIRIRRAAGPPHPTKGTLQLNTVAGLVSYGGLAGEGETWITPIEKIKSVPTPDGRTFAHAIDMSLVTYQDIETEFARQSSADEAFSFDMRAIILQKNANQPWVSEAITAYRAVISDQHLKLRDASTLPYPKSTIRAALLVALTVAQKQEERVRLRAEFLLLASWQDINRADAADEASDEEISLKRELSDRGL